MTTCRSSLFCALIYLYTTGLLFSTVFLSKLITHFVCAIPATNDKIKKINILRAVSKVRVKVKRGPKVGWNLQPNDGPAGVAVFFPPKEKACERVEKIFPQSGRLSRTQTTENKDVTVLCVGHGWRDII